METDDEIKRRHKVGIDCFSLEDDDAVLPSAEQVASEAIGFMDVIRSLATEREKFIALGLDYGFNKENIAYMLDIHPSRITRWTQRMRVSLVASGIARI